MTIEQGRYEVRLAETDAEVAAAQRLRYHVFVEEMGARPSPEDAADRRERDRYDPHFQHLLLIDREETDPDEMVVGVYRLMTGERARAGIGFYGSNEYDLSKLETHPRKVVELGRSCIAAEHRGGVGVHLLWGGVGEFVTKNGIEILFGVASFHGDDPAPLAQALSYLHHERLAPDDLRVRARDDHFAPMDLIPADQIDRKAALRQIPPLIKGYMRLGCFFGEGAWVDHEFNTVDVCVVMDTTRMVQRYRDSYGKDGAEPGA